MSAASPLIPRFISAGFDEKAAELASKSKFASLFHQLLDESAAPSDKSIANLLLTLASKYPTGCSGAVRSALLSTIVSRGIKSTAQLDAGIKYAKKPENAEGSANKFDLDAFQSTCGVGVVVTKEQIKAAVDALIAKEKSTLLELRYRHASKLLGSLISSLEWADGGIIKTELDAALLALLGPKNEEDSKKIKIAKPEEKKEEKKDASASSSSAPAVAEAEIDWLALLTGRDLPEARNTAEILEIHKKVTGGKPVTRFPPEPNGYLHIGHAKAMNFNFGLASKFGGQCIMRFDDTNPDAEKGEYIDGIFENLAWLGHKPARVTYSSDYFQQLYDLAVKLIRKDKAYVDHQTAEEIKKSRETKIGSPWRNRPIEESVKLFEDMRKGKFAEGKATLRMKGDMSSPNPQMWDLVAYRIKYTEHPHVGSQWCIYPSYDYSHCLIDSIENISHSCCTLEFEVRRESYYWLLHELDMYKPNVWEFSRLQIEYTVMSKRRLLKLVNDKLVSGWDDPRLSTLNGFRRRGYPATAIALFCETIGISRNENFISMALLEHCCRTSLEPLARRGMVVSNPVKVILTNYDENKTEDLDAPNFPKDETKGTHKVRLSKVVYIDGADFSSVDAGKDFFGLQVGKEVHLKYAYNIRADKIVFEADGTTVKEVLATVDFDNKSKCKGKITWVAEPSKGVKPLEVELRLYDNLFKSKDPMQFGGDEWLSDINPNSLIVTKAYADPSLKVAKAGDYFQFERVAFFVCDKDSTADNLVFNRTVTLKESKVKDTPTPAAASKKETKAK